MFSILSTAALRRAVTAGALAVLAAAQACGGDSSSSTSPRNNDSGPPAKYLLRSVDGHALPYQISRSPYYDAKAGHFYNELDVTVTGGAWDLDELGFADFYVDLSMKGDGVQLPAQHKEAFGTYEVQGS